MRAISSFITAAALAAIVTFGGLSPALAQTTTPTVTPTTAPAIATTNFTIDPSPTLVSLHLKGAAPQDALAELGKQANLEFRPANPQMRLPAQSGGITLDLEKQPVLLAMKELFLQANLTPASLNGYSYGPYSQTLANDGRTILYAPFSGGMHSVGFGPPTPVPSPMAGPAVASGAFLLIPQNLSFNSQANLSSSARPYRNLTVQVLVLAEPKLHICGFSGMMDVQEAVDENGLSLVTSSGPRSYDNMQRTSDDLGWTVSANLAYPREVGKRLARLKGTLRMLALRQSQALEIPDVLKIKDVPANIGGLDLTLKSCRKSGGMYEVELLIRREARSYELENQVQQVLGRGALQLLDAQGKPLPCAGVSSRSSSDKELLLLGRFHADAPFGGQGPAGEPAKLKLDLPVSAKEITIPVELTNLPLP